MVPMMGTMEGRQSSKAMDRCFWETLARTNAATVASLQQAAQKAAELLHEYATEIAKLGRENARLKYELSHIKSNDFAELVKVYMHRQREEDNEWLRAELEHVKKELYELKYK